MYHGLLCKTVIFKVTFFYKIVSSLKNCSKINLVHHSVPCSVGQLLSRGSVNILKMFTLFYSFFFILYSCCLCLEPPFPDIPMAQCHLVRATNIVTYLFIASLFSLACELCEERSLFCLLLYPPCTCQYLAYSKCSENIPWV